MEQHLIAPCGINCRVCRAYMSVGHSKPCTGCRGSHTWNSNSCVKNCEKMIAGQFEYCYECDEFPCRRVRHLDERYKNKYGTSVIENLYSIKETGIDNFVENENKKWACPECGSILCMHKPQCLNCGYAWLK